MTNLIKAVIHKLQIQYVLYLAVAIVLASLYEIEVMPVGIYAGDAAMEYALETIAILLTIALVPSSLKLFSIKIAKTENMELTKALVYYKQWSTIRLMILAFVTYLNIFIYYLTLNNIGGLCALIGLTASVFCLPSTKNLCEELQITNNNTDKE